MSSTFPARKPLKSICWRRSWNKLRDPWSLKGRIRPLQTIMLKPHMLLLLRRGHSHLCLLSIFQMSKGSSLHQTLRLSKSFNNFSQALLSHKFSSSNPACLLSRNSRCSSQACRLKTSWRHKRTARKIQMLSTCFSRINTKMDSEEAHSTISPVSQDLQTTGLQLSKTSRAPLFTLLQTWIWATCLT